MKQSKHPERLLCQCRGFANRVNSCVSESRYSSYIQCYPGDSTPGASRYKDEREQLECESRRWFTAKYVGIFCDVIGVSLS